MDFDEEALFAAVDLVGRTGADSFNIGYLHDGVPPAEAGWYAHAQYRGARITAEDHKGPAEAAEALARRLLTGAKCTHCGGLIALSDDGAFAYTKGHLVDGTEWTAEQAAATKQCRWTRQGRTWKRGCEGREAWNRTVQPRQPQPARSKKNRRKRR